jgi:hypothetical protein
VVAVTAGVETRIEWLDAPDVSTPELAATWARYQVWVGDQCVTAVATRDGTSRNSVYGSLYPLAEWIAENWWLLTTDVRPSAVDPKYWSWRNVPEHAWLTSHNLRSAGDGMAWPDLTVVPEGSITRLLWATDRHPVYRHLRFLSGGDCWLRADAVLSWLTTTVEHVLDRLAEQGLPKTRLAEEWATVTGADAEEREFCAAAARLGLDPYSLSERQADDIVRVAETLPAEIRPTFFDAADPAALDAAAAWWKRASPAAGKAASKARERLGQLRRAADATLPAEPDRPWDTGYAMARAVRDQLGLPTTEVFDISPWVGRSTVSAPSAGLQAAVAVESDRCGVVLGTGPLNPVFGAAKALGGALGHPDRPRFLITGIHRDEERVAGAFAAELLAPAAGIRAMLHALGKVDDAALDAVAGRYRVSPLLVRHQYDNQLAGTSL